MEEEKKEEEEKEDEKKEEEKKEVKKKEEEEKEVLESCVLSSEATLPFPSHGNSNWFGLSSGESRGTPYTYSSFVDALVTQIDHCLKKETVFGRDYTHRETRVVIEKAKYTAMSHAYSSLSLSHGHFSLPLLSFHSTQSVTKLNSILKYGYLLPGTSHPTLDYSVRMSNGALYGDGIYSSPQFRTAQWYTFMDGESSVAIVVNVLFTGE